ISSSTPEKLNVTSIARTVRQRSRPPCAAITELKRSVMSATLLCFPSAPLSHRHDLEESDVILDRGDGCIRCLVGPHRIHRSVAAEKNAVVSAVALVGAIGVMVRSFQQRHV